MTFLYNLFGIPKTLEEFMDKLKRNDIKDKVIIKLDIYPYTGDEGTY